MERSRTLVFCKKQTKILVHSDGRVKHSEHSAYNLSFHILQNTILERAWKEAKEKEKTLNLYTTFF